MNECLGDHLDLHLWIKGLFEDSLYERDVWEQVRPLLFQSPSLGLKHMEVSVSTLVLEDLFVISHNTHWVCPQSCILAEKGMQSLLGKMKATVRGLCRRYNPFVLSSFDTIRLYSKLKAAGEDLTAEYSSSSCRRLFRSCFQVASLRFCGF